MTLFDIFLFPQKWGTPIAGVVASFGVNKGPGVDTFAVGPAFGVVLKKGEWTYGVFNQNLISADDTATTQIQPILAYTVNKKISVAFGDQQFTYDWKKDRFVLVPLGFQINYIALLGKQPVRFLFGAAIQPEERVRCPEMDHYNWFRADLEVTLMMAGRRRCE